MKQKPKPSQFMAHLIERTAAGDETERKYLMERVAYLERSTSVTGISDACLRGLGRRLARLVPGLSPYSSPEVIAGELGKLVTAEIERAEFENRLKNR